MNSKLFTLHFSLLISLLFLSSCRQQAAKAYVTELDSNDSLSILMGNSEMTRYHSDKLDIDITYPSFLLGRRPDGGLHGRRRIAVVYGRTS